jgi:hypothetical protein
MNELTAEKTMTLKEVAEITGAAYRTVASYAQKAGWTQNGKTTLLNETQVTVILEAIKRGNGNQYNLASSSQGIDTTKSRALRIDLLHRQIENEMQGEIDELKLENNSLRINLQATKSLLAERESGLSIIQRIAEAGGCLITDRDDVLSAYRRNPLSR